MDVISFNGVHFIYRQQYLEPRRMIAWLKLRQPEKIQLRWGELCFELSGQELLELLKQPQMLGLDGELLRESYRRLAKLRHPDHGGSVEAMQWLNASYQKLQSLAIWKKSAHTQPPQPHHPASAVS